MRKMVETRTIAVAVVLISLLALAGTGCNSAATAKSATVDPARFRGTTPSPAELARRKAAYEAAMKNMPGGSRAASPSELGARALAERQKQQGKPVTPP